MVKRDLENKTDRLDVMVDIESLSMETGGTLLQICAKKFNLHTGEEYSTFNMYIDISQEDVVAKGETLKWWVEDKDRLKVFTEIIRKGKYSEEHVVKEFHKWLTLEGKEVHLWGNGILDDNRVLNDKFNKYNLPLPVKYNNHRDVRTLVDVACAKERISMYDFIGKNMIKGAKSNQLHNALTDVNFQIRLVVSAYNTVIKQGFI